MSWKYFFQLQTVTLSNYSYTNRRASTASLHLGTPVWCFYSLVSCWSTCLGSVAHGAQCSPVFSGLGTAGSRRPLKLTYRYTSVFSEIPQNRSQRQSQWIFQHWLLNPNISSSFLQIVPVLNLNHNQIFSFLKAWNAIWLLYVPLCVIFFNISKICFILFRSDGILYISWV